MQKKPYRMQHVLLEIMNKIISDVLFLFFSNWFFSHNEWNVKEDSQQPAPLNIAVLKSLLIMKGQKRIRGARKMNLFTSLVELWLYDSRNLCSKKDSLFEHLYGPK